MQTRQRAKRLESSLAEKTMGVFVDSKLKGNRQRALAAEKANGILGHVRRVEGEDPSPLLSTGSSAELTSTR